MCTFVFSLVSKVIPRKKMYTVKSFIINMCAVEESKAFNSPHVKEKTRYCVKKKK